MESIESIVPIPVISLIAVGIISLVILLIARNRPTSGTVIKSKWKETTFEEKPVFRGNLSKEEVAKHNKPTDAWIIVDGKVYDITTYIDLHPGGDSILKNVGEDSSEGFHGPQHPVTVHDVIKQYYIGDLI